MTESTSYLARVSGIMVDQSRSRSRALETLNWTMMILTTTIFVLNTIIGNSPFLTSFIFPADMDLIFSALVAPAIIITILLYRLGYSKLKLLIYIFIAVICTFFNFLFFNRIFGLFDSDIPNSFQWTSMMIFITAGFTTPSIITVNSILYLRERHAEHVSNLIYLYFLMICLGFGAYFYLNYVHIMKISISGTVEIERATSGDIFISALQWYLDVCKDGRGEVVFVFIVVSAVILPQILSFIVGGLFGCGKSPIFASEVSKFAVLSIVKFLCVFSALIMAEQLYRIYGYPVERSSAILSFFDLGRSLQSLAASFGILALYCKFVETCKYLESFTMMNIIGKFWSYMTRFTAVDKRIAVDTAGTGSLFELAQATTGAIKALIRFLRELRRFDRPATRSQKS